MTDLALAPAEAANAALAWIELHGIDVLHHRGAQVVAVLDPDRPVLHLLDPDAPAPFHWGELEDWVRLPADPAELYDRADRLLQRTEARRARHLTIDADDVLRLGPHVVTLTPMEATTMRLLIADQRRLVTRDRIEAALWPLAGPPDPRALDSQLKRLRHRLADLPLKIHTVRTRGYILEPTHP